MTRAHYYMKGEMYQPLENFAPSLKKGGRILDMGCGRGEAVEIMASQGANALGLDIRREEVRKDIPFVQGDGTALPFMEGSFDAVLSMLYLPHIREQETALLEMGRVLKRGGRALIVLFNRSPLNIPMRLGVRAGFLKSRLHYEAFTFTSKSQAFKMLGRTGFVITKSYTTYFLPPLLPSFLVSFIERRDHLFARLPLLRNWGRFLILETKAK